MGSWNRQYRGRSLGRVLHFVYHYCGFNIAETCEVGSGKVLYGGVEIASYEFLSDTDIPHFKFLRAPNYMDYRGDLIATWERNQKEKVFEAIQDAEDAKPEPCKECQFLRLKMEIFGVPHEKIT